MKATRSYLVIALLMLAACRQPVAQEGPPGYDLSRPAKISLPGELDEVSGITFANGNADTLYAEQDELGMIYRFNPANVEPIAKRFAGKGDYEDLTIMGDHVVVLRSDGRLFLFPLRGGTEDTFEPVTEFKDELPKAEYEGMYGDPVSGNITVLCKDCRDDDASTSITGHVLRLEGKEISFLNSFTIEVAPIPTLAKTKKKFAFRPSALAWNTGTKEWFVLSSVNQLLCVFDEAWKLKAAYPLSPSLFPQPEGIAFDRAENLFISNERGDASTATILRFDHLSPSK